MSLAIRSQQFWKRGVVASAGTMTFVVVAILGSVACGQKQKEVSVQTAPSAGTASPQVQASETGYQVETVSNGGVIVGAVRWRGPVPPPRVVPVQQDAQVCGQRRVIYPVRVVGGGIADAVVWLDDITHGKAYDFPQAVLDQKDCEYVPHVLVMQPGDLTVKSSDPMPHNVHTYPTVNREANENMNALVRTITLHFGRPDIVSVKCDLHGWMQAYVVVAKNPYYAVTGAGGRFELREVPAGHYRLKVWQETLGMSEQEVDVQPGQTTRVEFVLSSKGHEAAEVH